MRGLLTIGLVALFATVDISAQTPGQTTPQPTLKVGDMAPDLTLPGRGGAEPTVVEKREADFPMLSDPTMESARAYGVVSGESKSARRWTFDIDKTGKIAAIETTVRPTTSAEDMIAKLDELEVAHKK